MIVELDGETVVAVYPDIGYLHSGFEKQGETIRYKDFTALHRSHGLRLVHEQQPGLLRWRSRS